MARIISYGRRHYIGMLALLVALGGTSYAAVSSAPDRDGVFHGCVDPRTGALRVVDRANSCRKARKVRRGKKRVRVPAELAVLWNQTGPPGVQGPPGRDGAQGPPGQDGGQGPPGPFTNQLPSGKTLKGAAYITSTISSHSFAFSLPSAPIVHVRTFGSGPSAECPGTVTDPRAAPGHLCLYQANNSGVGACVFATDDPMSSCTSATKFGFGASSSGQFSGQWAVTAP